MFSRDGLVVPASCNFVDRVVSQLLIDPRNHSNNHKLCVMTLTL